MYTAGHSRLISTGIYLPEQRVTSWAIMEKIDSKNRFGIPYDWLERATGIRERRVAPTDMKSSDMAVKAALEAMESGGIRPAEIDIIIYCGVLRDHIEPATAHVVQHKIGAINAVALDVSNACLGFMSGMHLMDSLIGTGQARRGLVVTGERGYHYTAKACQILYRVEDRQLFDDLCAGLTLGDAGAAVIMGPKLGPDTGFMGFMVESYGQFHELCFCGKNGEDTHLTTKISEIVRETAKFVPPMYSELMHEHLKWQSNELDKYITHQVGIKTTKRHAAELKISPSIIPITVDFLGNIISATIPVNINLLHRRKQLRFGAKLYLAGTGSGISLSQAGLIWDAA